MAKRSAAMDVLGGALAIAFASIFFWCVAVAADYAGAQLP